MAVVKEKEAATDITQPLEEANIEAAESGGMTTCLRVRVLTIVNPASGKKAEIITTNSAGIDEVRKVLEANSIEADIVETEHPGHATDLPASGQRTVMISWWLAEATARWLRCQGPHRQQKDHAGHTPLGSANNVARMMNVPFEPGGGREAPALGQNNQGGRRTLQRHILS